MIFLRAGRYGSKGEGSRVSVWQGIAIFLLWGCCDASLAQVFELNGGASSLYEAQGAGIVYRTPTYQGFLSAGLNSGHFIAGANLTHKVGTTTFSGGMEEIQLDVPTDLSADHRLQGVGAGYQRSRATSSMQIFGGGTSSWLSTPIFRGAQVDRFAMAVIVRRNFSPKLDGQSQSVYSSSVTSLESLRWRPNERVTAAVTGGLGKGGAYTALTLEMKERLFDLRAGYVASGTRFERAGVEPEITAEPTGLRLDLTLRSSQNPRFSGTLSRQSFLLPASTAGSGGVPIKSSIESATGSTHLERLGLTTSFIHSSFEGQQTLALNASADYPLMPRVNVRSSYLESRRLGGAVGSSPVRSLLTNFTETIGPRLSASEVFSYSGGQPSLGFGGAVANNWVTLSAELETFYVPSRPETPFQQSLIVNMELDLVGRLRVLGGTFVSPNGKLLYNSELHALAVRTMSGPRAAAQPKFGNYFVHGRVLDEAAQPITGAAVDVDGEVLFTDTEGRFFLRERTAKRHSVALRTGEFLDGLPYREIRGPKEISSHRHVEAERLDHAGSSSRPEEASFIVTRAVDTRSDAGRAGTRQ